MSFYLETSRKKTQLTYRADIEGIRALAIVMLLFFTAYPQLLPGGLVGVDLFFVVSGYLSTLMLLKDSRNQELSVKRFYSNRIKRILPAYTVVLLLVLLLAWYVMFTEEFIRLGKHVVASLFFIENFYQAFELNYFQATDLKPTIHLWSMAVGVQFLLVLPWLFKLSQRLKWPFAWFCICLVLASFALNIYGAYDNPTFNFLLPFGRVWEIFAGAVLACGVAHYKQLPQRFNNLGTFLGFLCLVIALIFINTDRNLPGFWMLIPVLGTLLLLTFAHQGFLSRWFLQNPVMRWLGAISYPVFLVHWVLFSFAHIAIDRVRFITILICLLWSLFIGHLIHYLLEKPLRLKQRPIIRPFSAGALVLMLVAGAISLQWIAPRLNQLHVPTTHEWAFLQKSFQKNSQGFYEMNAESPEQILFIGDSHMAQYTTRLHELAKQHQAIGLTLAVGIDALPVAPVLEGPQQKQNDLIEAAYQVAEQGPFKKIVIAGAWNMAFLNKHYLYPDGADGIELQSRAGQVLSIKWLMDEIERLHQLGKEVYFVLDQPIGRGFDPASFKGMNRFHMDNIDFSNHSRVHISGPQISLHQAMLQAISNTPAIIIDPYRYLCKDAECSVSDIDGRPVYRDNNHFNPEWVKDNARFLDKIFE
ncbi:acyltransferase family protein [Brackiella oedipodis]|uniref:acyltransferase family protein n=1 Tax=Brackiella oedipodis TaxID=124225 RepID=UPI0004918044|nr:acyltransferase family protein [Brackiella oedipodis]